MQKYRIWIDQDSTIYDLSSTWYKLHNKDYPDHELCIEHVNVWNTAQVCKDAGCSADIYSYFDYPEVWQNGGILGNSNNIIERWQDIADLGIITTAANAMSIPHKVEWLNKNFPFIKDILISYKAHTKHLLRGDILIDDAIHNLTKYEGIRILYTQPWNQSNDQLLRSIGTDDNEKWDHIDWLVRRSLSMLDQGFTHREVEWILLSEQKIAKGKT